MASSEASIDYTDLKIQPRPSRGYDLSLDTSLAKVDQMFAKFFMCKREVSDVI